MYDSSGQALPGRTKLDYCWKFRVCTLFPICFLWEFRIHPCISMGADLLSQELDDDVAAQAETAKVYPVPSIGKSSVKLLYLQKKKRGDEEQEMLNVMFCSRKTSKNTKMINLKKKKWKKTLSHTLSLTHTNIYISHTTATGHISVEKRKNKNEKQKQKHRSMFARNEQNKSEKTKNSTITKRLNVHVQ